MDAKELQLDISAEGARALHRVVRAMHDGHCPRCGYLAPSSTFVWYVWRQGYITGQRVSDGHKCPSCHFCISEDEEKAALAAFQPHFLKSVEVFEAWRSGHPQPVDPKRQESAR